MCNLQDYDYYICTGTIVVYICVLSNKVWINIRFFLLRIVFLFIFVLGFNYSYIVGVIYGVMFIIDQRHSNCV